MDDLATLTDAIVTDVINILNSRNTVFIKDIFENSTAIKEKIQMISARIIEEMMQKSEVIVVATNLMIILTQIERVAGYSTNIAESIVFLVEGKIVKHTGLYKDIPMEENNEK